MPSQYPSIQSFFRKEVKGDEGMSALNVVGNSSLQGRGGSAQGDGFGRDGGVVERGGKDGEDEFGDGFTEEELHEAMDPLAKSGNPSREYERPKAVTFIGRVVSFATIIGKSANNQELGDGIMLVLEEKVVLFSVSDKTIFRKPIFNPLKLGQLLSIGQPSYLILRKPMVHHQLGILVCANLFPGRNTSDHLMIHTHSGCCDVVVFLFGYIKGEPLPGLMTLEAYLNGGYDGVLDVKLLVWCKDDTLRPYWRTKMKCWSDLIESVKEWIPGKTILLVSIQCISLIMEAKE
ncbi:uncharacterized protein EAF02_005632 [Botrytis sinoallii]|uniref:uncharacterized protein n=1 Tax=Botrytis sinoallii TaxID=1463999 RepID=UPI001902496F|nr:uncharacterized protein EAF02_005632 [Botrytis sinoallii]KAF7883712.1 hypothetical protein EAF02_005632 [Botrytis sinoallii]